MSRVSRARNHLASGLQFYASLPLGDGATPVRWAQRLAGKLAAYVSAMPVEDAAPAEGAVPGPRAASVATSLEATPLGDEALAAQVFGREGDLWTGRARRLLEERGVAFLYVDLEGASDLRLLERLTEQTRRNEAPWIFLRGRHVGGFHELDEIERLGQLDEMLLPERERGKGPRGRTRVVIAGREPS